MQYVNTPKYADLVLHRTIRTSIDTSLMSSIPLGMDKKASTQPQPKTGRIDTADGCGLAIDQWQGNRLPVVCAHGFGQTRGAWHGTARSLSQVGHAVITADARGHGQSDWNAPQLPYCPSQFVDDLIAVTGQLDRAPVLIGASMGGLFGLMAEARWPGLFSAMVLVDITPRWENAGVSRILDFMQAHSGGFACLDEATDAVAAYLPHRPRRSAEQLKPLLRNGQDGRLYWHWDPRLLSELAMDADRHQQAIAQAAGGVSCPVLLVSGGRSDLVSDRTIAEFLDLVPQAHHVRLPEATHMVAGDDNDAFTTTVMQYLDTLPALATDGLSATSHLTGALQ